MQKSTLSKYKNKDVSSSEQSLPSEWDTVNKRIQFLETCVVKLQKKNKKIEEKIHLQQEQFSSYQKEIKNKIEEFIDQNNDMNSQQKIIDFQEIKKQLQRIDLMMKKFEKKTVEIEKVLKRSNLQDYDDIDQKLEKNYQRNKSYIDKAVSQLKLLLKEYVKEQAQLQHKITLTSPDFSRSISKSRLSLEKNQPKNYKHSKGDSHKKEYSAEKNQNILKSPNQSGNRVNYLRQKLKQFEQINKKYEQNPNGRSILKKQELKTVQKMKDFRNYLQQSQSQIDQSNLDLSDQNLLSDSIKKWRSRQKYQIK